MNKKLYAFIIAGLVIAIIVGAIFGALLKPVQIQTQEVHKVFLDIDSDGRVDLLVRGDVIFNTIPLVPTSSAP